MIVRMSTPAPGAPFLELRIARPEDGRALALIDHATWGEDNAVVPRRAADEPFFSDRHQPTDVLVAVLGVPVGWVTVRPASPLASNAHVQQIQGLGVDPGWRGRGIGRALVEAACDHARARGARRITLRVLGTNPAARRIYEAAGFRVEGVLPGEFHLAGRDVDDILMGKSLGPTTAGNEARGAEPAGHETAGSHAPGDQAPGDQAPGDQAPGAAMST
jgi:ribosomal protein S18 acetylase RimI-like enzyme